ncbi:MAG: FAD-binding and (Fe-S)-binding domain-containing protein [Planctomycetota bacterium]
MPKIGAPAKPRSTWTKLPGTFCRELEAALPGEVSFDPATRGIYATDASHYQQTPACVITPRDEAECIAAVRMAGKYKVPITARGGGTSLSGQTFGPGVVIDCSRHMDRVLEINPDQRWARVQPGVIRDRLNDQLTPMGLHFAPDPATGNRATLGGMIGNNSSGTRSIVYGKTIDHVLSCRIALADGTVLDCRPYDRAGWDAVAEGPGREAGLYRGIAELIDGHHEAIRERYPKVMRRVSGYNLDEFVDGAGYEGPIGPRPESRPGYTSRPWNLSNLIIGSEGTLGVLLEATVRLTPLPAATAMCILHFHDVLDALRAVTRINRFDPSAVELLDRHVCREARRNRATRDMSGFIQGDPGGLLIVEFFGDSTAEANDRVAAFANAMHHGGVGYAHPIRCSHKGQAAVWETRKLGLGLISNARGPVKGQAFVEDACVPVEVLADYIEQLRSFCRALGVATSMYAHASVGVIHFRPAIDLHRPEHRELMQQIAEYAFDLSQRYGGVFAGEHGDGMVRGQFIPRAFGPELYNAFRRLKRLFDPDGLMNPGKIVDSPSMNDPAYLRYGQDYRLAEVSASFRYRAHRLPESDDAEGFRLAVEQCNGVGACRNVGSGTMCPSYMAMRDEEASTRGRANALRLAMTGQLGEHDLASHRIQEVLSLCLSCKACKTECPNAVDMAKLKADVTQMHYDKYGTPLGARLIAAMPTLARWGCGPQAALINALQNLAPYRRLVQQIVGLDARRPLPRLARRSFMRWYRSRPRQQRTTEPDAVLLVDTWMNCFEPGIGAAAVELLEGIGVRLAVQDAGDLLRPMLSMGMTRRAKREAAQLFARLDSIADPEVPLICLEPSDASALVDDLPDLLDDEALAGRIASRVTPVEGYLASALESERFRAGEIRTRDNLSNLILHGHCHQKALFGTNSIRTIADRIPGVVLNEIDAGCCGMAGSFGYEHYDLSVQIAEERLLPAVKQAVSEGKTIVACGSSCRQQLRDLLGVEAKHLVEVLRPVT